MSLPRLALAVIGDEISPSLDEMISFCTEHQVRRLDMRTVDGRNLLGMSLQEGGSIARRIEAAGLSVPTFVSPLLKWPAPGKEGADGKVDFAFDPADCPADDPLVHAFDMATVLGAERIREPTRRCAKRRARSCRRCWRGMARRSGQRRTRPSARAACPSDPPARTRSRCPS